MAGRNARGNQPRKRAPDRTAAARRARANERARALGYTSDRTMRRWEREYPRKIDRMSLEERSELAQARGIGEVFPDYESMDEYNRGVFEYMYLTGYMSRSRSDDAHAMRQAGHALGGAAGLSREDWRAFREAYSRVFR